MEYFYRLDGDIPYIFARVKFLPWVFINKKCKIKLTNCLIDYKIKIELNWMMNNKMIGKII